MTGRREYHGFTLLEVMVATTVLGIGILSAVAALSLASRTGTSARGEVEAARLAQRQIEVAVQTRADGLAAQKGQEDGYQWRLQYEPRTERVVLATITVQWQERGQPQSFMLRELFRPVRDAGSEG